MMCFDQKKDKKKKLEVIPEKKEGVLNEDNLLSSSTYKNFISFFKQSLPALDKECFMAVTSNICDMKVS